MLAAKLGTPNSPLNHASVPELVQLLCGAAHGELIALGTQAELPLRVCTGIIQQPVELPLVHAAYVKACPAALNVLLSRRADLQLRPSRAGIGILL